MVLLPVGSVDGILATTSQCYLKVHGSPTIKFQIMRSLSKSQCYLKVHGSPTSGFITKQRCHTSQCYLKVHGSPTAQLRIQNWTNNCRSAI